MTRVLLGSLQETGTGRPDVTRSIVCTRFRALVASPPVASKTISNAGVEYGILGVVQTTRKITVEAPAELLEKAQRATGSGITQTVRTGLELVAASEAYARLRQLRGKVRFSRKLADLKADR